MSPGILKILYDHLLPMTTENICKKSIVDLISSFIHNLSYLLYLHIFSSLSLMFCNFNVMFLDADLLNSSCLGFCVTFQNLGVLFV